MVTLEISSTNIRLMETEKGRVIKWASCSLEPGMFEEEVISDPQALSAAVKQLMTSSGIHERNIIASVSGLYSVSRIITVPTPPGALATQQAVLEAARRVMPLSEEELYLSWQTTATFEGSQQVLVVGVPRDVIDSEVQTLRTAGVNPRILDLKAMALIRAVNREQALILNIEPSSFDMVVVVDGVAEIMNTTAWQPANLDREEQAEHLAGALELAVGFYNSHHLDTHLDLATPLFITGQMSGDLALMEKLQARMEYPIEPLTPPLECPAHLPVSQYAVNIGLTLKGTALPENSGQGGFFLPNINLLPQVYQPWKPSARQIYVVCIIIAAIALLFPLYQVTSQAMDKTATLEARYAILNNELQQRQAEIKSQVPLQKAIAEYHTIVDMGDGFTEDLRVIRSQANELGVEVTSITHAVGTITLTCQADSYITFRNYITALEESGRFSSATYPREEFAYIKGGTIKLETKTSE